MKKQTIYGPPGTGKTTYLMGLLEKELETTDPRRIAFVSFTKKGTYEGVDRAKERFGLSDSDLPFFRTIHSLAFRAVGATRDAMISKQHYRTFSKVTGIPFTGYYTEDFGSTNDLYLHTISMKNHNPAFADRLMNSLKPEMMKYIEFQYAAMKSQLGIDDFDDLLLKYLEVGHTLPVKVAFIDEGQDLTPLQWKVVRKMFKRAEHVYVAGDDDQAVYEWSGSNVKQFLTFSNDYVILDKSYRLPSRILDVSRRVVGDIRVRKEKAYESNGDRGIVDYAGSVREGSPEGGNLVLARTNFILRDVAGTLRTEGKAYIYKGKASVPNALPQALEAYERHRAGVPGPNVGMYRHYFKSLDSGLPWQESLKAEEEDIAYYERVFSGNKFGHPKPVKLETFHSSKGGESDRVLLLTDLSARVNQGLREEPDAELRCLYVGLTRAKKHLTIVTPQGKHHYPTTYFD